jgi:hypothetical protein
MKNFLKKNLILIIAFALPILFISAVAIYVRFPFVTVSTDYDFVYVSCKGPNTYGCANHLRERYGVVDGKLVVKEVESTIKDDIDGDGEPDDLNKSYYYGIFLHNTKTEESREISLEEVEAFSLNGLSTSPDGVSVSRPYNNSSDFIFGRDYSYDYYLQKGRAKKKLNLLNQQWIYNYYDNFYLVGWVLPGRSE